MCAPKRFVAGTMDEMHGQSCVQANWLASLFSPSGSVCARLFFLATGPAVR